jgi:ATP-dependent Clp protease protease subunit
VQKAAKILAFHRPEKDGKTVNLYIYGAIPDIDMENWSLINTAQDFVKEFKELEDEYDRINIRINSPGGSVFEGLPIFNTIRNSKADVHTYNEGLAASMGAVILLAPKGKKVHAAKNSLTMLHNSWGIAIGDAEDMREAAKMSDKVDEVLIQAVADKSGKSTEAVKSEFFDYKDHWLTADDAEKAGLIDFIEDEEGEVPEGAQDMSLKDILAQYNNVTNQNSNIMSLKSWFSRDNSGAADGKVTVSEKELSNLKADMQAAQNELDTAKEQLENAKTEAVTAQDAFKAETEAHKTTQDELQVLKDEFEAFKKEPGATHSTVNHQTDPAPTGNTKPLSAHKQKEQEIRERAEASAKK